MIVKIYKQCFKNSFLDRVSHTEGILWTLYVAEANIELLNVSVSQALVSQACVVILWKELFSNTVNPCPPKFIQLGSGACLRVLKRFFPGLKLQCWNLGRERLFSFFEFQKKHMHAQWGGLSWQRTKEFRNGYWVQEQTSTLDCGRSAVTSAFLCCICVHSTMLPVSIDIPLYGCSDTQRLSFLRWY